MASEKHLSFVVGPHRVPQFRMGDVPPYDNAFKKTAPLREHEANQTLG